jgi:hypothetical protein
MAKVRLTLEIEPGVEPISGRLRGPQDQQLEFCGWTALATTIDSVLGTHSGACRGGEEEGSEGHERSWPRWRCRG